MKLRNMLQILKFSTLALSLGTVASAQDVMVSDAYARSSTKHAKSGAAFLMIMNHGDVDDRLLEIRTPFAAKVQLHVNIEDDTGMMTMRHVEEGFALPAGGMIHMARGGEHVMLMGVSEPFEQGRMIPMTLVFEKAGEIEVEVPVDQERKAGDGHGAAHDHGAMN